MSHLAGESREEEPCAERDKLYAENVKDTFFGMNDHVAEIMMVKCGAETLSAIVYSHILCEVEMKACGSIGVDALGSRRCASGRE